MSQHKSPEEYSRLLRSKGLGGRDSLYFNAKNKRQFQTSLEVLWKIALSDKAYQYELKSKIGDSGVSYRTLLRHLETLKEADLIEIDHLEPSSKRGINKNIWRVTFVGMLLLVKNLLEEISFTGYTEDQIQSMKDLFSHRKDVERIQKGARWRVYIEKLKEMDKIAEKHPDFLPLVFGKWHFFEKEDIKKRVIDRLTYTTLYFERYIQKILSTKDLEEQYKRLPEFGKTQREDIKPLLKMMNRESDADLVDKATADMIRVLHEISEGSLQVEKEAKETLTNLVFGLAGPVFGLGGPMLYPDKGEKYLLALCKDEEIKDYIKHQIENRHMVIENGLKNQLNALDSLKKLCKL